MGLGPLLLLKGSVTLGEVMHIKPPRVSISSSSPPFLLKTRFLWCILHLPH